MCNLLQPLITSLHSGIKDENVYSIKYYVILHHIATYDTRCFMQTLIFGFSAADYVSPDVGIVYNEKCILLDYRESVPDLCEFTGYHIISWLKD